MKQPRLNFPARWQAVLYRNYGFVDEDRLAQVLGTDRQTVRAEAAKLGLGNISFHPEWLKSGYITVIKNNWFCWITNSLRNCSAGRRKDWTILSKKKIFCT